MTAATGAGGVLTVLMLAGTGFAVEIIDDPIQIDERTADVVQTSNSLAWELHRYHRQNPDFPVAYKAAKQLWSQAGALRDALRAGPMETEALAQQVAQMNESLIQVENSIANWGDGDRSQVPLNNGGTPRTVLAPRVGVSVPFVGVQVGGPRYVVTEDGPPTLQRRRLHPNSRASRKSLDRELAGVRTALSYLMEDSGVSVDANPPTPGNPGVKPPVPQPPETGLGEPVKVGPPAAKTTGTRK
jgi:hypothetical protein